ncbi:MAG: acyl carrier protein [Moorea sp. SIO4E2]|uniref:acyl carrier protein n=1 Tax=Moorena sp. SIO4E2 TaxID=2607826 RepID=UPI0013B709A4|nr:acyl carrier protein [Moorena sp. SIO4E2]NEQ05162.1 acyl carrier protein [Moorena sp. SIO4E2]
MSIKTRADITQTTKELVLEVLPGISSVELLPDSDILNLGLDSINAMNLLSKLQKTFAIELSAEDITFENFQNLNGLVNLVEKKRSQSG